MIVYPLTIYFDGTCRLCRSEFENIIARDVHGKLRLVDCSKAGFDTGNLPVNQAALMNLIHGQDASGNWVRGVDVFIAAYQAADLDWVSRILRHPWIRPYAERYYPWLVRNRYRVAALGLHRILNFFTHRGLHKRAGLALANSRRCRESGNNVCKPLQE